jgi:hypothetical protein
MTRIALLFLTIGAFAYAAWLVLRGKPLPQPARTHGLKRRFLLATLLFVGLMSQASRGQDAGGTPDPNAPSQVSASEELWVTIRTVWRTLDPNQAEVFRQHLEMAVADGQVRQRVADILSTAFTQIADQNQLTPADTPLPPPPSETTPGTRRSQTYPEFFSEKALLQIRSLRQAQDTGGVSESFSQSVQSTLSREIEMMWLLQRAGYDKWPILDSLWQRYWSTVTAVLPIDSAAVAAKIIVEFEGGAVPSVTTSTRLVNMQNQVDGILLAGPDFSDWRAGSVSPYIESMMEGLGLIHPRGHVMCYRSQARVTERTAELQALQAELLQKCVDANVIDAQVAAWAAEPNAADPNAANTHAVALPLDFALEAEIRAFQKQVRCVMVTLYDRGEAPSSFIRNVELAADIEILPVDANEARRRDMGYYFHALLDCPSKEAFAKALEERGLIPPAQNHRMVSYNYDASCEADPNQEKVAEFISLLDSGEEITLEKEPYVLWLQSPLATDDMEYRAAIRRVCRILMKLGYLTVGDMQWLTAVEQAIGIPLTVTINGGEAEAIPPGNR